MSNIKDTEKNSLTDKLVITATIGIVAAGLFVYVFLQDNFSTTMRLSVLLGSLVVAAVLFFVSPTGRKTIQFGHGAVLELKRVVWPTKDETIKMTGVVFLFVFTMALFLWIVDLLLNWLVYGVFLGWN